jgi:hypothetical protein
MTLIEKAYLYWARFFIRWYGRNGTMRYSRNTDYQDPLDTSGRTDRSMILSRPMSASTFFLGCIRRRTLRERYAPAQPCRRVRVTALFRQLRLHVQPRQQGAAPALR